MEEESEQQKARRAVEALQAASQDGKALPGNLHGAPEPSPSLQMHSPRIQWVLHTTKACDAEHFVPASVPPNRRLQTTVVVIWGSILPLCTFLFLYLCSIPPLWPFLIIYVVWIVFDRAPARGGRPNDRVRRMKVWRLWAGYFPVSLVKSCDLPATRKYVFGYHPHGIIGMGAIANFGTEATGFSELFPGLKPHLLTVGLLKLHLDKSQAEYFSQLTTNFHIPFYRDILMALGICSVSYRSCQNILRRGPGSSLTIVVGGAAESLSARPGTADLVLRRRLGFIKLAIREGADLVPVFSFGENDIFEQLANEKGTRLYKIQKRFQSAFGFTLPIFHGRGILNYTIGFLPYRHPIVSVVGRPIHVKQSDNPSTEQMSDVQQRYIEELTRIWDTHKNTYAVNRRRELSIVD